DTSVSVLCPARKFSRRRDLATRAAAEKNGRKRPFRLRPYSTSRRNGKFYFIAAADGSVVITRAQAHDADLHRSNRMIRARWMACFRGCDESETAAAREALPRVPILRLPAGGTFRDEIEEMPHRAEVVAG